MQRIAKPALILLLSIGFGISISWGDTPLIQLPPIKYQGPDQDPITLPTIVYHGPVLTEQSQQKLKKTLPHIPGSRQKAQRLAALPKLVLQPQAALRAFYTASRVPLKVICNRDPGEELQYEFQRRVKRQWRADRNPRLLRPVDRPGLAKSTVTRHVKFSKAGKYRWRCRAGLDGSWSPWSPELEVVAPGGPTVRTPAPKTTKPARNTRERSAD